MHINPHTKQLISLAIEEDIGRGDCTTEYLVPEHLMASGEVVVKQAACIAGLPLLRYIFHAIDPKLQIHFLVTDGEEVSARTIICTVEGSAHSILQAERTALNFLARLSGIATTTKEAIRCLTGTSTKLLDTRKTTPGWRAIEKYAVRIGGGQNHRFGLDDMVLIKDNHIAVCGGVAEAIQRAKAQVSLSQKIEVEVDSLEQLDIALEFGADLILLDNMSTESIREAVLRTAGRVPLEASGNMTSLRLREVAQTGVDYISMGALTHSAISIDVGLDLYHG